MVVKKTKTAILLKENPDAELTLKGQAPRTLTEEHKEKLKIAREKAQEMIQRNKSARDALKNIKLEPLPEPIIEPKIEPKKEVIKQVEEEPEEGEEEEEPVKIIKKKEKKKKNKPTIIIEESSSEEDESNVIYIKKKNRQKNFPQAPYIPEAIIPPPIIRQEIIRPKYSQNPFYNYNNLGF